MNKNELENGIKESELELSNVKSGKIVDALQKEIIFRKAIQKYIPNVITSVKDTGKQIYVN